MLTRRVHRRSTSLPQDDRRGTVLLIVLVVIALLSLAAYGFTEMMIREAQATAAYARMVESRVAAESGIELAAAYLGTRTGYASDNFYDNPEFFYGILARDGGSPATRSRFSLVAPLETDPSAGMVRYGLMDESGKINLNAISQLNLSEDEQVSLLLFLPGMTYETADAILDFLDEDDLPRAYGAESEYYSGLAPPYTPKNGPLDALEELLMVRGVTPELLFGEDANRNGLLDPNENDGNASPPFDNADGILDLGWSAYFTIYSRESNRRSDGTLKIDLNQQDLVALYDLLEPELGEEAALFVAAYRKFGPAQGNNQNSGGSSSGGDNRGENNDGESGGGRGGSGRNNAGGDDNEGDGGSGEGGGGNPQSGGGNAPSGSSSNPDATRGGVDLSGNGQTRINSIYDLLGATVNAQVNGQQTPLESPWTEDPSQMTQYLPDLLDRLSTTAEATRPGRININSARPEILMGIPGLEADAVEAIISAVSYQSAADLTTTRATTGWLVTEGIIDLATMRQVDRFLTTRGDVYRVQSVGCFDDGGAVVRLEAVIDATQLPPRIVFFRDLTHLGRGYPRDYLIPPNTGF